MSKAKDYLLQMIEYESRVDHLNADIFMLEGMLLKITPTLKMDQVSSSGNHDKLGNLMAERLDKMQMRDEAWAQYVDFRKLAWETLRKIEKEEFREILEKRYFENKSLKEISIEMIKDYRYIRRLHGRALQAYEKEMEKEGKAEND